MAVLIAEDIELSWGDLHVLQGADLRVDATDRVGLVGPNGCGKSTLLSIMAGIAPCDAGVVRGPARVAILSQDPQFAGTTVDEVVSAALEWHHTLLAAYEQALTDGDLDAASVHQAVLDDVGWVVEHRIESLLTQTGAPPRERDLATLSGGERRRLALAATLLAQPDVLLLDEPTNHLDAGTISWLEKYLQGYRGAVVMVTHDRYLLEAVADRIVEIEQGKTVCYEGSYTDYLLSRAERQALLQRTEDRHLRLLARETAWAAKSPSARSTKQKARLARLETLQDKNLLPRDADLAFDFSTGLKTSGTMIECQDLTVKLGDRVLIKDLDFALRPGDRIGVIGPNGIGKSTLLRALLGELPLEKGVVHKAPRVKLGVLDQARTGLVENHTVFEAAGEGNDQVLVGETWIHVATFLRRMLFDREQYEARVSGLSGGERARLLLAKKMLEGNAVLLLDEPTNDLDLWTLRVLEEALLSFDGAVLVVTHDRAFLDRVCTGVLAFEGDGKTTRYADRIQADRAAADRLKAAEKPVVTKVVAAPVAPSPSVQKARKLSYREQKELDGMEAAILQAEGALAAAQAVLADPATYQNGSDVPTLNRDLDVATKKVEALYARWEELANP